MVKGRGEFVRHGQIDVVLLLILSLLYWLSSSSSSSSRSGDGDGVDGGHSIKLTTIKLGEDKVPCSCSWDYLRGSRKRSTSSMYQ